MADRYCSNCGHELSDDTRFCPECGRPVHETAHVPTPEADIPVPPPPGQQQAGDAAPPPQQTAGPIDP
jgi:predicted amidophosphoribosyltransferase